MALADIWCGTLSTATNNIPLPVKPHYTNTFSTNMWTALVVKWQHLKNKLSYTWDEDDVVYSSHTRKLYCMDQLVIILPCDLLDFFAFETQTHRTRKRATTPLYLLQAPKDGVSVDTTKIYSQKDLRNITMILKKFTILKFIQRYCSGYL